MEQDEGNGKQAAKRRRWPRGWLLLESDAVPDAWRDRAISLSLVPLLPDELSNLVRGTTLQPGLDPIDERMIEMVAQGLAGTQIGRHLRMPLRTVERRLARLRRRYGVETTAELTSLLATQGLGMPGTGPPSSVGGTEAPRRNWL